MPHYNPVKDSIYLSDAEIEIILDALDHKSEQEDVAAAQDAADLRTALFVRKQVRLREETLKAEAARRPPRSNFEREAR